MAESARTKATLFVGGLAAPVTGPILHEAFVPFGPIVDVTIPPPELPSSTEPHRGFGYVEFESTDDAREAIDNMDQSELFGRVINVKVAKEKKVETEGLGSKTAVWEQEGYLAKYAVSDEDRIQAPAEDDEKAMDPMQGLEALDTAGPKLQ
ncbi:RNA-binding domain-containing protein [Myriangium duriaei CBS 260.36]|uniref:RNA-binding domain-containing protein n=1 Tax=Myriangium duriaei CBS 260.36 TaxID=1168546 RepID=A0A9P4J5U0_9PEZI|nr:RNA-binding domain-containing protein [Myriangium duriaei CBS 260.36]